MSTVVPELGRFQSYVDAWKSRIDQSERDLEARKKGDLERARRAARALVDQFGATGVWVFGSLVSGARYDETSDIDMAVKGVPPDRHLDVWGLVESICAPRPIDLVMLEAASPSLRRRVVESGVEIS